MIDRYPLTWPVGQPRCRVRRDADFTVELGRSINDLLSSLKLLGASGVVLSTSIPLRRDGLPYASLAEPADPGAAVYFDRKMPDGTRKPFVIACDSYRKVRWNIRAIWATVEALRSIQRHGATSMLEQAFTGFAALPPAPSATSWWDVLGVRAGASLAEAREAYKRLAAKHHPDRGGDPSMMVAINHAWNDAQKALAE